MRKHYFLIIASLFCFFSSYSQGIDIKADNGDAQALFGIKRLKEAAYQESWTVWGKPFSSKRKR